MKRLLGLVLASLLRSAVGQGDCKTIQSSVTDPPASSDTLFVSKNELFRCCWKSPSFGKNPLEVIVDIGRYTKEEYEQLVESGQIEDTITVTTNVVIDGEEGNPDNFGWVYLNNFRLGLLSYSSPGTQTSSFPLGELVGSDGIINFASTNAITGNKVPGMNVIRLEPLGKSQPLFVPTLSKPPMRKVGQIPGKCMALNWASIELGGEQGVEIRKNMRFNPPQNDDFTFVTNVPYSGECLSNGTVEFDISVGRDIGDVDRLLENGLISESMILETGLYFKSGVNPFCYVATFNGQSFASFRFGSYAENTWLRASAAIPTNKINFATWDDEKMELIPGMNKVKIISTPDCGILFRDRRLSHSDDDECLAVDDWMAIKLVGEPTLPILLLHGTFSSEKMWEKTWRDDPTGSSWKKELIKLGVARPDFHYNFPGIGRRKVNGVAFSNGPTASIESNAANIGLAIQVGKDRYGVSKLKIVAHSKGGVDSRHYVEYAEKGVAQLIQIATPNEGTELIETALFGLTAAPATLAVLGDFVTRVVPEVPSIPGGLLTSLMFGVPAAARKLEKVLKKEVAARLDGLDDISGINQMRSVSMKKYNKMHGLNRNIRYFIMAGDYSSDGLKFSKKMEWRVISRAACGRKEKDNCDGVVSVKSAFSLADDSRYAPLWTTDKFSCKGDDKTCEHNDVNKAKSPFYRNPLFYNVMNNLGPDGKKIDSRSLQQEDEDNEDEDEPEITVSTHGDLFNCSDTSMIPFVVDEVDTIMIVTLNFLPGKNVTFELIRPNGTSITAEAGNDLDDIGGELTDDSTLEELVNSIPSGSAFYSLNEPNVEGDIYSVSYYIRTASSDVGTWQAHTSCSDVSAKSRDDRQERMTILVGVKYVRSMLKLGVALSSDLLAIGESLNITASLLDGNISVTDADVNATVWLEGSNGTMFLKNLNLPLQVQEDGVYLAEGLVLDEPGNYFVYVAATGLRPTSSDAFAREALAFMSVVASKSLIYGVSMDYGVDDDGDGLYESLEIRVFVDVKVDGKYRVFVALEDMEGNEYTAGVDITLKDCEQDVIVSFDGVDFLVRNQVNGPYTVTFIGLSELNDDGAIIGILDEQFPGYETEDYRYDSFDIPESDRKPPVASCKDVEVDTDPGRCFASDVSVDNGSTSDEGLASFRQLPPGPYVVGKTGVYFEIASVYGIADSCNANINVVDNEPPLIDCGVRDVSRHELKDGKTVEFALSANDNCDDSVTVYWSDYSCSGGKCSVQIQGDQATISMTDEGTKVDLIAYAADSLENTATKTCSIVIGGGSKSSKAFNGKAAKQSNEYSSVETKSSKKSSPKETQGASKSSKKSSPKETQGASKSSKKSSPEETPPSKSSKVTNAVEDGGGMEIESVMSMDTSLEFLMPMDIDEKLLEELKKVED